MKPQTPSRSFAILMLAFIASVAALASACSSSGSASSTFKGNGIVVSDVWARESAGSAETAAVYFKVENTSSTVDKLFSASVPQTFAKSASIHEMVMAGGSTSTSMMMGGGSSSTMANDSSSMMSMKEVASVTIPANGTVDFEPGGYHVMLEGLTAPLSSGQKFDVNLGFLNGGVIKITATVRAS